MEDPSTRDRILARRAELVALRHERAELTEQINLLSIDWERRPTWQLTNKLAQLRDLASGAEERILIVSEHLTADEEAEYNALHELVAQGLLDPALVPSC